MEIIETQIHPDSPHFRDNSEHHRALVRKLREAMARVQEGGGPEAGKKHHDRGKLLARERKGNEDLTTKASGGSAIQARPETNIATQSDPL